jgi:hypothetical protein
MLPEKPATQMPGELALSGPSQKCRDVMSLTGEHVSMMHTAVGWKSSGANTLFEHFTTSGPFAERQSAFVVHAFPTVPSYGLGEESLVASFDDGASIPTGASLLMLASVPPSPTFVTEPPHATRKANETGRNVLMGSPGQQKAFLDDKRHFPHPVCVC